MLNQSSNRTPSLISVIVPAYGEIENIAEQLTSLGQQDYDGCWEIVIADNGMGRHVRAVSGQPRRRVTCCSIATRMTWWRRGGLLPWPGRGAVLAHSDARLPALYRVPAGWIRYRRPQGLRDGMWHQFEFGLRAHSLYRAAGWREPLHTAAVREMKRIAWLITRSPYLLLSKRRRGS